MVRTTTVLLNYLQLGTTFPLPKGEVLTPRYTGPGSGYFHVDPRFHPNEEGPTQQIK